MKESLGIFRLSRSFVSFSLSLLLCAGTITAQSRIVRPQPQTNVSAKRQHVATLRASDSPDGSRVALSSDQSLNDYEAYRRGDRFYVKIPQSEVPRAETVRGRGFADVKAQKTADSTVVSFRLQPGATAHVEQRGNKLDVVFTLPGGRTLSGGTTGRASLETDTNKRGATQKNSSAGQNTNAKPASTSGNKNLAAQNSANPSSVGPRVAKPGAEDSNQKNGAGKQSATPQSIASTATPETRPNASAEISPSPSARPSASAAQNGSVARSSPPTQSTSNGAHPDEASPGSTSLKDRVRYWILLAQLNPAPVAIGLGLLVLLVALLLLQRRRAKAPRRVRASAIEPKKPAPEATAVSKPIEAAAPGVSAAAVAAGTAGALAATPAADKQPQVAVVAEPKPAPADGIRRERVAQVAEQAKRVLTGDDYDQALIGSSDRETRQLVGAELLTGLVGRDAARRERARTAFMKYGYFDDATRDLRVAESANERAAAARRLSFVHDREATPHLIGALHDSSPDVRRAAVEALMDLRDPSAIGPLNTLMQTENDRKVPRTLIKHAIDACATSAPEADSAAIPAVLPANTPEASPPAEHEREVIEL